MSRTYVLERAQVIPADRDRVFAFFSDAANLETITPGFLRFRILTPMPVAMREGAHIEYALSLLGVPIRWRTRITRWEPGVRFTDEQERGPYSFWRHTHSFEAGAGGTTMRDRVEYALPLGMLGRAARALFVRRALERVFDYRREAIARLFRADAAVPPRPERAGPQREGEGTEEPPAVVLFGPGGLRWFDIGDSILGGASRSGMTASDGIGTFRGAVSLGPGGGFASVRSEEGRFDLSGFTGLLLRARGDGKRYGLRLRASSNFDGVCFQAEFRPEAGVWNDIRIPFRQFRPVFRGRPVAEYPPLDLSDIRTFGLIIAGRQEGPFRLELESIRGYRGPPA